VVRADTIPLFPVRFRAKNCGIGFGFSMHSAVVHGSDSPLADGGLQSSIQVPGHKTRTRQPYGRFHCPDVKKLFISCQKKTAISISVGFGKKPVSVLKTVTALLVVQTNIFIVGPRML